MQMKYGMLLLALILALFAGLSGGVSDWWNSLPARLMILYGAVGFVGIMFVIFRGLGYI